MSADAYPKVGHFKTVEAFRAHLSELGVSLPCDDKVLSAAEHSSLAKTIKVDDFTIGNRWCVQPMEGWDGTPNGEPTEHTLRRWRNFGRSGAKLIWGGEAFAVQGDGRANPNQVGIVDNDYNRAEKSAASLLNSLYEGHREIGEKTDDLLVGLQLTHSGRFCRPRSKTKLEPRILYHHPLLDKKFHIAADDHSVLITDDQIHLLIDDYVRAAKIAHKVGYRFVDVKHCHGYLGHEFLSARVRPGQYGGSLENRTRFAHQIIRGIQSECPGMMIGVRFSAFDFPPFRPDPTGGHSGRLGPGLPEEFTSCLPYLYGFGCNPNNPLQIDLSEPIAFVHMLERWGVKLINVTCGSPYYNPHIQRPAIFPPSDGYQPPEDPLVGVARQMDVTRKVKLACPRSLVVGSGYTYLQEYLPNVAQAAVAQNWVDSVGLGRLILSYWDLPHDLINGKSYQSKRLCRTFSDCTTAPRNGLRSGCYPLDDYYKTFEDAAPLKKIKSGKA